jgi:hypothetical protein
MTIFKPLCIIEEIYIILRLRLFVPVDTWIDSTGPSGPMTPPLAQEASVGTGGATSTIAMVGYAHHATDVLLILGLTAATTFLAKYRLAFWQLGWEPKSWELL